MPAEEFEDRCQCANILAARTMRTAGVLEGTSGGVVRLSVQEITRQGMTEADMTRVASLIHDAVSEHRSSTEISETIRAWVSSLGPIRFSFDAI